MKQLAGLKQAAQKFDVEILRCIIPIMYNNVKERMILVSQNTTVSCLLTH